MFLAMASLPSVAHVDVGEQVRLGGQRRGLRLGDRPVDQRPDLGVDRVEVRAGQFASLGHPAGEALEAVEFGARVLDFGGPVDRKSTRLNSSHGYISYAVFCLTTQRH